MKKYLYRVLRSSLYFACVTPFILMYIVYFAIALFSEVATAIFTTNGNAKIADIVRSKKI